MFDFDTSTGRIRAYGVIGDPIDDGIGPHSFMEALDAMDGRDVEVQLQSDGGSVVDGISIYNQLKDYTGRVAIKIDSMAASIASVVAMAGDEIVANSSAILMIHNPWAMVIGDAAAMRGVAEVLDVLGSQIADIYAGRAGQSRDYWVEAMSDETYYTAAQAADVGLVDRVVDPGATSAPAAQAVQPIALGLAFPRRGAAAARLRAIKLRRDLTIARGQPIK